MTDITSDQIRVGEALYRAEAHLAASVQLYGKGRKPDALLQAARPVTDILPELETELRSTGEALDRFFAATGQVGAAIRRNDKPRALRKALREVVDSRRELLKVAVGAAAVKDPRYSSSVSLALLERIPARYRAAVEDEDLGAYQDAYAVADSAGDLIHDANGGRLEKLEQLTTALYGAFPAPEPPPKLARPEDVEKLIEEIAAVAVEGLGATVVTSTLTDSLARVDKVLGDVLVSYEKGLAPLSARLAASLFVRSYDPVRHDLAAQDPDAEARLTALLGFELRKAINEGAPPEKVRALATEAHELLTASRS